MTRTKARRLVNKKRSNTEERMRIENKVRDFDVNVECEMANLELKFREEVDKVQRLIDTLKTRVPKKFLQMTINQIRELSNEVDRIDASFLDHTTPFSNLTILLEKSARKKSKDDEESEQDRLSTLSTSKRMGPLMSSKYRRRSKSAGAINNSNVNKSLFHPAVVDRSALTTSMANTTTGKERTSRPRTKMSTLNRPKAISVDRIYGPITPKVQPSTPLAIIRHARLGESVFSVTGSPVITANILESTANVNIPIENGMLSIRPTEMTTVDPTLVSKINPNVLSELKQLQENLNKIMRNFNKIKL